VAFGSERRLLVKAGLATLSSQNLAEDFAPENGSESEASQRSVDFVGFGCEGSRHLVVEWKRARKTHKKMPRPLNQAKKIHERVERLCAGGGPPSPFFPHSSG